jgi:thiamine phosphate synthase YjbQ (UPF0047 family)
MKSYRKELNFHTNTRRAYVNITPQVEAALSESGIREGLCLVNAMNITASVFINDNKRKSLSDASDRQKAAVGSWSATPNKRRSERGFANLNAREYN